MQRLGVHGNRPAQLEVDVTVSCGRCLSNTCRQVIIPTRYGHRWRLSHALYGHHVTGLLADSIRQVLPLLPFHR